MLHHLLDYAQQQNLAPESGFAPKEVRWLIPCDGTGKFLSPLRYDDKKGKSFDRCPDMTHPELVGGGKKRSHFLVESADVAFLLLKNDITATDKSRIKAKHKYFVDLLREAGTQIADCAAIAAMLSDAPTLQRIRVEITTASTRSATPTDKVTFAVDGRILVESESWHGWWRDFRKRELGDKSAKDTMRCLLTGETVAPAVTHDKIKGLAGIGGLGTGDALVSFDKDAFCSFGIEKSANCAIGKHAAKAYVEALNDLIRKHGQQLAGAMVVHWFKQSVPLMDDPLPWVIDPPAVQQRGAQSRAAELLQAIKTGRRPELAGNQYYALAMSGASGRVMVRDWMEGGFPTLVKNVGAWFGDLAIVRRDGDGLSPEPKFKWAVNALYRDLSRDSSREEFKRRDKLLAQRAPTLWRAAAHGDEIPRWVIGLALPFAQRNFMIEDPEDASTGINETRLALLKAYVIRNTDGGKAMMPCVNEDHPDSAYHAGRLLAVLADLQRRALGSVGSTVVQRYYVAASQTPGLVTGRLIANAKNHLSKLKPGSTRYFEEKIAKIACHLGNRLPRTLDLERQTTFALGYYQQLADDRTSDSKPTEGEQDDE